MYLVKSHFRTARFRGFFEIFFAMGLPLPVDALSCRHDGTVCARGFRFETLQGVTMGLVRSLALAMDCA